MPEQQFKRNIAYKIKIGDIGIGKPIFNQDKFLHLELGIKKMVRVNVIGNIVDKFESEGDKKYIFYKLDDGSGQISIKVFGEDVVKFKDFIQGQTVVIIGLLRNWNNETYITPEIIKEMDVKYLLIRKLEIEKDRKQHAPEVGKKQILALKDRILEDIKKSENENGIEKQKLLDKYGIEASIEIINQEIQKLLEDGIIFEPKPNLLRYLG